MNQEPGTELKSKDTQNLTIGETISNLAEEIHQIISSKWDEKTMELIKHNGAQLVADAQNFQITNQSEYDQANEFFVKITQYKTYGNKYIEPFINTARQPWSVLCDIRTKFDDPATLAKKTMNDKIVAWKKEMRKRAEAEQERLNAERRAKEEAERIRLETRAREERERAQQEKKIAEEKARIEREAAIKARHEKEEAEARAAKAEADRRAAEQATARAIGERNEAEAKAARAEAVRLAAEQMLAQKQAAEKEAEAFKAEQKAQREIDRGVIAEQERLEKAEAFKENAENVFVAPKIANTMISKTETTTSGKAIGRPEWEIMSIDEMALIRAVANGKLPLSVLNLDSKRLETGIRRWAKVSCTGQRYNENGIILEATEALSGRANKKAQK